MEHSRHWESTSAACGCASSRHGGPVVGICAISRAGIRTEIVSIEQMRQQQGGSQETESTLKVLCVIESGYSRYRRRAELWMESMTKYFIGFHSLDSQSHSDSKKNAAQPEKLGPDGCSFPHVRPAVVGSRTWI
jgi:hypothetical protein